MCSFKPKPLVQIGLILLLAGASGCASVRSFFSLEDRGPPVVPIHNPFDQYNPKEDASENVIMRTRKGDRSVEIEIPGGTARTTDLAIPVTAALQDHPRNTEAPKSQDTQGIEEEKIKTEVVTDSVDETYTSGIGKLKRLYRLGRYEGALIETDLLLRQYPKEPKLHQMRGTLLDRVGQSSLALRSWKQALELDPGNLILRKFIERRDPAGRTSP